IEGKKDSALIRVREAMHLLEEAPNTSSYYNYYENICYAMTEVYRAFTNADSVYKYSQLYTEVHDSLERAAATSRLEIARIKLDNLQNVLTIKNLNKEKEAERLKRNFMLGFIVLLTVIALLIINWQWQKSRHRQQIAMKDKAAAEAEVAAAKDQLSMFKQN